MQAVLRRHARVHGGGGAAAQVHHGRGRWCGRAGRRGLRLLLRRLHRLGVLLALGCVGGDAVLRQELLQVHVLQLEVVGVVRQRLVPEGRAQEGRLWVADSAALILQLFSFVFFFTKSWKVFTDSVNDLSRSTGQCEGVNEALLGLMLWNYKLGLFLILKSPHCVSSADQIHYFIAHHLY